MIIALGRDRTRKRSKLAHHLQLRASYPLSLMGYALKVSVNSRREPDGSLVITETGKPLIRILGLAFAAPAIYMLYHLLLGFVYAVRAKQLLSFLPGSLLLIFMAALFGLPAMILMFGSRKVHVPAGAREIRMVRNYGFYRKREIYFANNYDSVQAFHRLSKVESRQTRSVKHFNVYPVRLVGPSDQQLEVASADDPDTARTIATEISTILGFRLIDRTNEWDAGSKKEEEEEEEGVDPQL